MESETKNTSSEEVTSAKKSKKPRKQKIQIKGNEYIQNALEKALTDIKYWENWRELLNKLQHDLSRHYRDEHVQQAMNTLYSQISMKESEAWKHSFMWALGMSDYTRRKIMEQAKERFLVSDRDHHSFEIMSHLDPRLLTNNNTNYEEEFRQAIRDYFKIGEEEKTQP